MQDAPFLPADPELMDGFRLEELVVNPRTGEISGPGGKQQVDPRVMSVLTALAGKPGTLVTRTQLLEQIWPGGGVYDDALTQCVYQLRQHISAAGGSTRYRDMVRTLPKRGYLLKCEVRPLGASPAAVPGTFRRPAQALAVVGAAVLLVIAGWLALGHDATRETVDATAPAATTPLPNSIAVLPFIDLSPEQNQQYFSYGISEELLNRLAKNSGLTVIARTSSFSFQGSDYSLAQISALLGVEFLLEGSVRRDEDKLRVSVQLSDAAGVQLWSESYDRELGDIFTIQDEIAQAVVTSVVPQVASGPVAQTQQRDIEAYQHYLVGREVLHSRVANFDNRAAEEFKQAIRIDPDYADAYAELGIALSFASDREWYLKDSPRIQKKFAEAEQAIAKALMINPEHARAHAARGFLLLQKKDRQNAEISLRQAIELDPTMADASYWLAAILADQDNDEGWELLQRTARIDPLLPELNYDLAFGYAERGDFLQADRTFRRLLAVQQPAMWTFARASEFFSNTGRPAEGVAVAKLMVLATLQTPFRSIGADKLAQSYAGLGMADSVDFWLEGKSDYRWYGGFALEKLGRFEDILQLWSQLSEEEGVGIADQDVRHVRYMGHIQALAGHYEQAIETLEPVIEGAGPDREFGDRRVTLAFAYLKTGALENAQSLLDDLYSEWRHRELRGLVNYSPDLVDYALVQSLRDEPDRAINLLQQAYDSGWRGFYSLVNDPRWDSLQTDSRFQALMSSVGQEADRQRAEVERIDAEDEFAERVRAIMIAQNAMGQK